MMNENTEYKLMCMLQKLNGHISVPALCKDYCNTFGHEFPFRELGFVSMEQYLKSLREVSCIWFEISQCYFVSYKANSPAVKHPSERNTGFGSSCRGGSLFRGFAGPKHSNSAIWNEYRNLEKIRACLVNLVKSHEDGVSIPKLSLLYEEKTGEKMNLYDYGFNTLYDFVDTVDELRIVTKSGTDRVFWTRVPQSSKYHHHTAVGKQSIVDTKLGNLESTNSPYDSSNCVSGVTSSSILDEIVENRKLPTSESCINDTLKNNFRTILKNHPDGVWASQFFQKYKELTGCEFEMQSIGYYNFITLIEDLPGVFAWKEKLFSNGDFLLFDAATYKESCKERLQGDAFDKLRPEEKLKDVVSKIRCLLRYHEDGIYLDEFFHIYKLNYGRVFSLQDLGWQSLKVFLDSIAEEVPLCTVSSSSKTKVYSYHPKSCDSLDHCIMYPVPSDIVDADARFKPQWIPVGVNLQNITYVYLGSVADPGRLYIQFDDGNMAGVLDQLMEDLHSFYSSDEGELYKMNDFHVQKGTICVGVHYQVRNWNRIEIEEVYCDDVQAYFVDYGSVEKIHKKDLRYLRKKFYDLPSQAVVAGLANVMPRGIRWDSRARDLVLDKCSDGRLKACVFGQKMAKRILYLYLWDINHNSQSHSINDILVHAGYASYCDHSKEDADIIVNPNWPNLKYQIYPAETNVGILDSTITDLPASFGRLKVDADSRHIKSIAHPASDVTSAASMYGCENDRLTSNICDILKRATGSPVNETLLPLLLNVVNQNGINKNATDIDFSDQLILLGIIQKLLPLLNTSSNISGVLQHSDLIHSLLNIVNKNKMSDAPSFTSLSGKCSNNLPSSAKKAKNPSFPHSATSFSTANSCDLNSSARLQTPLFSEQSSQTNVNRSCRSTFPDASSVNFSSHDEIPYFIPPPRPPSHLDCDELQRDISSPLCASSSALRFNTASLSHSLNSSQSSDEKFMVFRSTSTSSSSLYDQELTSESLSPSSLSELVPFSFKSTSEGNEPDVYNEMYDCPLENLCKEIMLKSGRNVKRLFLRNRIAIHIIQLMGRPHVSCYDVAWITVGCGSTSELIRKTDERNIARCPIKIYKTNDEILFDEIERYGIRKISHRVVDGERIPVLPVFPLRLALDYVYALATCPKEIVESIKFQITQPDLGD